MVMMQMQVVLRLILDELKQFLILRDVRVAGNFEDQTLKCSDLSSSVSHCFNTNGSIVITNRADCINDKSNIKITLEKVKACLFYAHMSFNAVEDNFFTVK